MILLPHFIKFQVSFTILDFLSNLLSDLCIFRILGIGLEKAPNGALAVVLETWIFVNKSEKDSRIWKIFRPRKLKTSYFGSNWIYVLVPVQFAIERDFHDFEWSSVPWWDHISDESRSETDFFCGNVHKISGTELLDRLQVLVEENLQSCLPA